MSVTLTPNTGTLQLERDKPVLTGLAGALSVVGLAGSLILGTVIVPTTGALAATGQEPGVLTASVTKTPPTGELTVTGSPPVHHRFPVEVLADSPVAYYRLNEAAGPTLVDHSGNGRHGTYQGGVTFGVAGVLASDADPAVQFNGSTGYAAVAVAAMPSFGAASFTVEFLMRSPLVTANRGLILKGGNGPFDVGGTGFEIRSQNSGNNPEVGIVEAMRWPGLGSTPSPRLRATYPNDGPAIVHFTYDIATGTARLYMNGQLVHEVTLPTNTYTDDDDLWVGRGWNGFTAAVMDEVALYTTALSPARIAAHVAAAGYASPGAAALTATPAAPATVSNNILTPGTGAVTATGYAPSLQSGDSPVSLIPFTVHPVLTGQQPITVVDTRITPVTGALTLTRGQPLTPGTASLSLAGSAPSLQASASLTPGTAALVLTGQPGFTGTVLTPGTGELWFGELVGLQPNAGALSLTGVAPTRLVNVLRTPATATLAAVGAAGQIQGNVFTPGTGALVLTGSAPAENRRPDAAALALVGSAPGRLVNTPISPATAALVAAGAAPAVVGATRLTPGTGSLETATAAPTLAFATRPGGAALVLEGGLPQLDGNRALQPDAGTLSLTGAAPTLQAGGNAVLTPGTATLTAASAAGALRSDVLRVPSTAALVATGAAPIVQGQAQRTPGTATLTLTGAAPDLSRSLTPGAAVLTAAGQAPAAVSNIERRPATGALVATGAQPATLSDTPVQPATGTVVATGQTPTVTATGEVIKTPGTGALALTGAAPFIGGQPPAGGRRFRSRGRSRIFPIPRRER